MIVDAFNESFHLSGEEFLDGALSTCALRYISNDAQFHWFIKMDHKPSSRTLALPVIPC